MTPLEKILIDKIRSHGPINIATFMEQVLCHPEFGYYTSRDPLGRSGDFITAPEISQMFGELMGLWAADLWHQMGKPSEVVLFECGPGRGTLMADMLRVAKKVPEFAEAIKIHLLETSPVLREKQRQAVKGQEIVFHDDLPVRALGAPVILIANEFLDALPVRQLIRNGQNWDERTVAVDSEKGLIFSQKPLPPGEYKNLPQTARDGEIFEISPAQDDFTRKTCNMLKAGGAGLFIDYGYTKSAPGDTLQAVRNHRYVDVLEEIGQADLTAHVNFERLAHVAQEEGAKIHGPVTQSRFLLSLGLAERAENLIKTAQSAHSPSDENSLQNIKSAVLRLSGPTGMGQLFKAICLTHDRTLKPAGF